MKNLILQVGRIDKSFNNPISFKYNDGDNEKKEGYPLSSFFWKNEVLNKNETEILLLYPVSLPIQDINDTSNEFLKDSNEFLKEVANLNIDDYLKDPNDFFQKHPHSEGNKFLVINSIGTYKKDNKTYSFYSSIEEITLQILLKLVKEYSDIDNIYIDISSGQNIYITSMINAVYRFIPYHEILHGFGQNKKLNAYIISCDPIIPGLSNHSYTLSSTKFSAKAFFELPYNIEKLNDFHSLFSKINKRNFREFIKTDFPILFYSFKFSFVPLLIYLKSREIQNKWEINDLVCAIYNYINDNKFNYQINNKKIFFSEIVGVLFSAAFYNLFCSLLKNLGNLDEIRIKVLMNGEGSIDDVEIDRNETFKQIFNQIKNIQNYDKFKSELEETIKSVDFSKLSNSYSKNVFMGSYKLNTKFNPRNFVAHYGLEKNSVEYKLISASNNSYEISIKNVDNIDDKFRNIIRECQKY